MAGFFDKLGNALFYPGKLFEQVKREPLAEPLKFVILTSLILGLIVSVLFSVAVSALASIFQLYSVVPFGGMLAVLGAVMIPVVIGMIIGFMLLSSFVTAAVLHIFARLFGGKGGFTQTYKACAYAGAVMLFIWIPILNFAAIIWNLIILTKGISKLHAMSEGRALLVWIIPLLIVIALLFGLFPAIF